MDNDFSMFPLVALEEGLARVANKKSLYARLLNVFSADPKDKPLLEAFENRDLDAAYAAAHTIKGMAANLSLARLVKYTEMLESLFKQGKDAGDISVFDRVKSEDFTRIVQDTVDEIAVILPTLT